MLLLSHSFPYLRMYVFVDFQEKAAKRLKHLESGGHDVSGLRSRMEEGLSFVKLLGLQCERWSTTEPE